MLYLILSNEAVESFVFFRVSKSCFHPTEFVLCETLFHGMQTAPEGIISNTINLPGDLSVCEQNHLEGRKQWT